MGELGGVGFVAEFAPVGFGHFDAELFGGGFDVVEGFFAICVGDVLDLVEAGNGVADVGGVVEGFFALFGEGEGRVISLRTFWVIGNYTPLGFDLF